MSDVRHTINISPTEIETLYNWVNNLEPKPHVIELIASPTGIGTHIRAEYETSEGEGRFKDITDYESW